MQGQSLAGQRLHNSRHTAAPQQILRGFMLHVRKGLSDGTKLPRGHVL